MADNPMTGGFGDKLHKDTSQATKDVNKLDDSLGKLSKTLGTVYSELGKTYNSIEVIGESFSKNAKGIEKYVQKIAYFTDSMKGVLEVMSLKDSLGNTEVSVNKISEKVINKTQEITKSAKESAKVFEDLFKKTGNFSKIEKETLKASGVKVPSTRGLVGYKGIKDSAELVSSETKRLADGTKQLVEVFKVTNEEGTTTYKAIDKKIIDIKQNMQDINKEQGEVNKRTSKFGILLKRIERIAVYRMIRTGLKLVVDTFKTSISNLAQFNQEVNNNVSTMTSAFTKMQNSVAIALYPLLNSLAPFIDSVSNKIVGFANELSLANAQLTGQTKYLAVNEEYMQDYAKAVEQANNKLLSFDKFESLQQDNKPNIQDLFDERTVDGTEKVSESVMSLAKILNQLDPILSSVWNTGSKIYKDIIEPILPDLMEVGRVIVDIVSYIVQLLDKTGLLEGAIYAIIGIGVISKISKVFDGLSKVNWIIGLIGAGLAILNIKSIIEEWNNWGDTSKAVAFGLIAITVVLTTLATALLIATKQYAKALTVGGLILGAGTTVALGVGNLVNGYENGGIPAKSELYYMNEYGKPEAMVSTGGQTNVINQDQLRFITKEGFKEAIYETGLLDALSERLIVEGRNIDNNTIARGLFNALKVESERRGGNQL